MTSSREILIGGICLMPFIGYVVYLIGLQDYSLSFASRFGEQVDLGGQIDFLYGVGVVEIGVLGAGLAASLIGLRRSGSVSRSLLRHALILILLLVSVLMVGLNLYYRYVVTLLGL